MYKKAKLATEKFDICARNKRRKENTITKDRICNYINVLKIYTESEIFEKKYRDVNILLHQELNSMK